MTHKLVRDHSTFMRSGEEGGGGGGRGWWGFGTPFKNFTTPTPPPQVTNFFTWPPYSGHFFRMTTPHPQKINRLSRFYVFLIFSIIPLLLGYGRHVAPCRATFTGFTFPSYMSMGLHYEDNNYNPYTTKSCLLKENRHKSKDREVNFGSPS